MYIAIYCLVIGIFCGLSIFLFVYYQKKQQRKLDQFNSTGKIEKVKTEKTAKSGEVASEIVKKEENELTDADLNNSQPIIEAQFEDYTLETPEVPKPQQDNTQDPYNVNLRGARSRNSIDDKFAEYEDFLRRHIKRDRINTEFSTLDDEVPSNETKSEDNFDDNLFNPNFNTNENTDFDDAIFDNEFDAFGSSIPGGNSPDSDDLDALANFDFESLNGKSDEEIEAIISTLPERAQEIIRSDIFKRNEED